MRAADLAVFVLRRDFERVHVQLPAPGRGIQCWKTGRRAEVGCRFDVDEHVPGIFVRDQLREPSDQPEDVVEPHRGTERFVGAESQVENEPVVAGHRLETNEHHHAVQVREDGNEVVHLRKGEHVRVAAGAPHGVQGDTVRYVGEVRGERADAKRDNGLPDVEVGDRHLVADDAGEVVDELRLTRHAAKPSCCAS